MDYNSIHGPGISNFSSSSPHRMPTVSAAQALQDLNTSPTRCVSTSLRLLDFALQNRNPLESEGETLYGGVSRGKVTEIYGPPGVGKTTLGMYLAANALYAGEGVLWVDTSHPVSGIRFSQVLASFRPTVPQPATTSEPPPVSNLSDNLVHYSTPTLAHLIALLSQPNQSHPAENTSLIVIDSFSTLINNAFPRSADATATPRKSGVPNPAARKFPILQYIVNALQKIAATRNIAIVVFSQCITKMRPGAGAVLVPAINTTAWEQGLGCRVALFRDWGRDTESGNAVTDVRLAQVMKAEGINVSEGRAKLVGFTISEKGLHSLNLPLFPTFEHSRQTITLANHQTPTPALPQKRKLGATDLEIPDSDGEDDEDYGWAGEDEDDIPPPPPQWQGSEDILVPAEGELDVEDVEEEPNEKERSEEDADVRETGDGGGDTNGYGEGEIEDSEDELAL